MSEAQWSFLGLILGLRDVVAMCVGVFCGRHVEPSSRYVLLRIAGGVQSVRRSDTCVMKSSCTRRRFDWNATAGRFAPQNLRRSWRSDAGTRLAGPVYVGRRHGDASCSAPGRYTYARYTLSLSGGWETNRAVEQWQTHSMCLLLCALSRF